MPTYWSFARNRQPLTVGLSVTDSGYNDTLFRELYSGSQQFIRPGFEYSYQLAASQLFNSLF